MQGSGFFVSTFNEWTQKAESLAYPSPTATPWEMKRKQIKNALKGQNKKMR